MIVPLYKGKGERNECKNYIYRGISSLGLDGIINAGILVDILRGVIRGFIDDEQGGFRAGRECVDQSFTLKQIESTK